IHDLSCLRRVVVSTYQSISGSGGAALRELEHQVAAAAGGQEMPAYTNIPRQLAMNVLAGCWRFREDGFQDEEAKMIAETHKILHDDTIAIAPTTVRVPVTVGHSESIWLETEQPIGLERLRAALRAMPGIELVDDLAPTEKDRFARTYPTPLDAAGQDP